MQKLCHGSTLIDTSDWKQEEIIILQGIGVECLNPRDLGLKELVQKCRYKKIITIDTALAHLCAVTGTNATLLLNQIPDERWTELHQPYNCYGKYLTILQQTQPCNWEEPCHHYLIAHQPEPQEQQNCLSSYEKNLPSAAIQAMIPLPSRAYRGERSLRYQALPHFQEVKRRTHPVHPMATFHPGLQLSRMQHKTTRMRVFR